MTLLTNATNSNSDFAPTGQFQQVAASILLVQQGSRIQTEKLKTARIAGIIDDEEYRQWVHCLEGLKREWIEKDFTNPHDILFLKFMSLEYFKKVKGLKFPSK